MATIVPTRAMLDEARQAYHNLQLGLSARVVVDQNGERVEFTAANRNSLYLYIQQLEQDLGTACGSQAAPNPASFPATFIF